MPMSFEEFVETYDHEIIKIVVDNKNTFSAVQEVVLRIIYDDLKDDEDIRFSLQKKSDWLPHQRDANSFYILIPNNLQEKTIIYGHIIPKDPDLIEEYDENRILFSRYNFEELYDHLINNPGLNRRSTRPNQFDGTDYEIRSNVQDYDYTLDYDEEGEARLTVQSRLNRSIDEVNNPNYKNYVETEDGSNETEKGKFPLSSRYRTKRNFQAPDLTEQNPKWGSNEDDPDTLPVFEVRINRKGLSPLINNGTVYSNRVEQFPVNVYLEYEYLPTSREYHQHYYGLEPEEENNKTDDKVINVLEGARLYTLDNEFNTDNYRIINWGDPYNNDHTMYVNHDEEIPVSFASGWSNYDDLWTKNLCYDYYALTGGGEDIDVTTKVMRDLEKDRNYSLRFFMFIPSYTTRDDTNCLVKVSTKHQIITNVEEEDGTIKQYISSSEPVVHEIDKAFLRQITNEWIYHEIPFVADEVNVIEIVPPTEGEIMFFTGMVIQRMPRYTPTLQYTERGIQVIDMDDAGQQHNTNKSANEEKKPEQIGFRYNDPIFISEMQPLPTPFIDIVIGTGNDYDLIYDDISKNLYFIYPESDVNLDLDISVQKILSSKSAFIEDIEYEKPNLTMIKESFSEIFGRKYINNAYMDDEHDLVLERNYFNDFNQLNDVCTNMVMNDNDYNIDIKKEMQSGVRFKYYNFPEPQNGETEYSTTPCNTIADYERYYRNHSSNANGSYNYIEVIDDTAELSLVITGESDQVDFAFGDSGSRVGDGCCLEQNTLYGFYSNFIEGTRGPGNYINLYFYDQEGNPVNDGYATIEICKNKKGVPAEWEQNAYNFKKKYIKNGTAQWGNVDFTYLKKNNENENCPQCNLYLKDEDNYSKGDGGIYYLKITYGNDCEYKEKTIYKMLYLGQSDLVVQGFVNEERNSEPQFISRKIFAEDLPIKISAYVYDKNIGDVFHPVCNTGWCELSINDKKNQSTLMDLNGECDFYLDVADLDCGETNTIKIEYYTKYNQVICFTYFELEVDDCDALKEAIPIVVKMFTPEGLLTLDNDENNGKIESPEKEGRVKAYRSTSAHYCYDDYIMQSIETGPHQEYSITIERYISTHPDGNIITVNGVEWDVDQYWQQSNYKEAPANNIIFAEDILYKQELEEANGGYERFLLQDAGMGYENGVRIQYTNGTKISSNNIEIINEQTNQPLIDKNNNVYYHYRITTDNPQYEYAILSKEIYRPYQRVFTIVKHPAHDTSLYEYEGQPCRCDERIKTILNPL